MLICDRFLVKDGTVTAKAANQLRHEVIRC
jgi:hypothetical protein